MYGLVTKISLKPLPILLASYNVFLFLPTVSGTVYCFGDGRNGQLGIKVRQESPLMPIPSAVRTGSQGKIIQVSCGAVHTAAISGITK